MGLPDMSSKQPLLNDVPPRPIHSSGWRRFSTVLCAAAVGYILVSSLVKYSHTGSLPAAWTTTDDEPWGPRKDDGHIITCANLTPESQATDWHGLPFPGFPLYTSKNSFILPDSSGTIFLFSRGSHGHGSVRTELADLPNNKVEIEVISRYHTMEALNHVNVCLLDRMPEHGQGVGIYTPTRRLGDFPGIRSQITFDVTIRFPRSGSSTNPLVIDSLETDMGIWRHDIGSLEGRVVFKSLSLSSSNAAIHSNSVSSERIKCTASNGQITGSYNVSEALTLRTSNAAITIALRMENRDGRNPTRVNMQTSNARLESAITLISTDSHSPGSPAEFSVIAKTSNSPLSISFPDAPTSPFSRLSLDAVTSNAAAHTKLHSTFEGSISLRTSIFMPNLVRQSSPVDPSGKGRQWKLRIRRLVRGILDAQVWWGESEDEGKGVVSVTTSNAHNTLELFT